MTEPSATIPGYTDTYTVIRIPGTPTSWKRPRQGGAVRYTDPAAAGWSRIIAAEAEAHLRREGYYTRPIYTPDEPVALDIVSCFPRPAKPKRDLPLGGYADVDNLAKIVMDALQGIAYADDAQVARITTAKGYVDGDGFVEVTIYNATPLVIDRDPQDVTEITVRKAAPHA